MAQDGPRFYGRRRGKKLRPGRAALVRELLPKLRVPAEGLVDPEAFFSPGKRSLWLEIGFGAGEHLAAQAQAHPETGFIGCEPFVNGVAALLAQIQDRDLDNIRIFDEDARLLLPRLPDAAIERVYLLYSDPWPKKRHWNRRFVNSANLDQLARIMVPGGLFRFATDHPGHARWALGQLTRHPVFRWTARGPADWRARPADGFVTRYEAKARSQGATCVYLEFQRLPSNRPAAAL